MEKGFGIGLIIGFMFARWGRTPRSLFVLDYDKSDVEKDGLYFTSRKLVLKNNGPPCIIRAVYLVPTPRFQGKDFQGSWMWDGNQYDITNYILYKAMKAVSKNQEWFDPKFMCESTSVGTGLGAGENLVLLSALWEQGEGEPHPMIQVVDEFCDRYALRVQYYMDGWMLNTTLPLNADNLLAEPYCEGRDPPVVHIS